MSANSPSETNSDPEKKFSSHRHLIFGWSLAFLLVFGVGGWSAFAELTGAIMASGTIVVDRNVKKLQHREGGIVAAINVQPGDLVKAGDVLVRLDDTQTKAELDIVRGQMVELTGRKARLEAERDGMDVIAFPPKFSELGPDAERVKSGEVRLFDEARKSRESQQEQLRSRISQLHQEIKGVTGQRDAKNAELGLISKELAALKTLQTKQLIASSRLYAMEREATRLTGEHGSHVASIARAHGQIAELNLQLIGLDQNVRSESQKELRSIEARLAELAVREIAAIDRLSRMDLKAPQGGIVHELAVHTVGGVVSPAEPVLLIVPGTEALLVEARFSPTDRDQIAIGQAARLRFTAFNQRTTPEVVGVVTHIAADVVNEARSGQSYYNGRVRIDAQALAKLEHVKFVPGMPVEVIIATAKRTALSYFTKPFVDQFNRAFREE